MRDYFISYASEDRHAATQLVEALEKLNARCFIDHRDITPGHPRYRDRLIEGISDCECIVVLLSRYSQASDEVDREVQAAHDRGRRRLAVWLEERGAYTNGTLELLLASSQDIVWGGHSAHDVAQRIRATATVSTLRAQLTDYQSVVDQLQVDLSKVFARVEAQDLNGAVAHVKQISMAILRRLWRHYQLTGAPPDELRELILGCRDHFEHQSLIAGFTVIEDTARKADVRPASMDATTKAIEQLMTVLSVLRTQRWGLREIAPRLRSDAAFLSGLLIEAGWLQGSELVPNADVVYMVFERARLDSKRYLEILLGDNENAIAQISQESEGRIFSSADAPVITRFVLVAREDRDAGLPRDFLTPDEFVIRFTGVQAVPDTAPPTLASNRLAHEVERHLPSGRGNVLVYGPPGVGKSNALRELAMHGWPGAPRIRFLVDYAGSEIQQGESALDVQLAERFPVDVRPRTRELVRYLVRTGRAALLLDSIECATSFDQPVHVARTFARLCSFLSHDSTVVMAGREAALRDSATVREFFMKAPAVSDVLAQTLRSTGVDAARLPSLQMLRARRRSEWQVAMPRDRLIEALSTGVWDTNEEAAATELAAVVPAEQILDPQVAQLLTRTQIVSLARGGTPPSAADALDVVALSLVGVSAHRVLREFRAALDYVRAAIFGVETERWADVSVGETTRRLVRLLSRVAVPENQSSTAHLALVGPPTCIIAVPTPSKARLTPTTVTAGQFREFLRALPLLPSLASLAPGLPDESQLHPMYERIPDGLYRDDARSDHPAIGISWWAADSYARWSGTRLPTSLEWEVAGRGWDGRIFPWGDTPDKKRINCADRSAGKPILDYAMWREAMRAGEISPCAGRASDPGVGNRSPTGQLDMVGNVWEWVSTDLGAHRVIAGGSYDNPLRACVLSSRSVTAPSTRSNAVGFRVVEA